MNTFDTIIEERLEEGQSTILVEPVGGEPLRERAFLAVRGDRQQVIVDYGWDDAGTMFITVQTFVDGEPVAASVFEAGQSVMLTTG